MTTVLPVADLPAATGPDGPEQYRARGWWRETGFLDDLRRCARERPHKTAVVARRLREARADTLTYAEIARLTDRFAGALVDLGVGRGEVVAVQAPNRWEIVPLLFACLKAGAVLCPIAPGCPPEELRHRLALTEAVALVTVPSADLGAVADLRADLPALRHVLTLGEGTTPPGALDFHARFVATAREERESAAGRELGADEPFVVLFTSGTTGESKGVLHSQNTVYAAIRGYVDVLGLGADLVAALTTPLIHYSGFGQGILVGVLLGATVLFQDHTDNPRLLDLIESHRATLLYGPPPTIGEVLAAQRATPRAIDSLRQVVVGAAPVLADLVTEVRETLGAATHSIWGMSEFGPITVTRLDYDPDWAAHSHGAPIGATRLRLETEAADGDTGRLLVRGASRALGYYRREAVFDAQITPEGWFETGDVARADGRGGVRILGRAKDAVVRDGIVAPMAEIEAVLGRHPSIRDAALVGLDDPDGPRILVVLVPADGESPTLAQVRAHLLAAGQDERFLPDRVEQLPALPKTLTGKVRKVVLRQHFQAGS